MGSKDSYLKSRWKASWNAPSPLVNVANAITLESGPQLQPPLIARRQPEIIVLPATQYYSLVIKFSHLGILPGRVPSMQMVAMYHVLLLILTILLGTAILP